MADWIAGVDGCRKAWAAVFLDLDDPGRHRAIRVTRFADIVDAPEAPRIVGVDVPIGLPERTRGGGRFADQAARGLLGRARSSVFPVPPRSAVACEDYVTGKHFARLGSDPPRAFSIQCFNILPYIREVDGVLRSRPDLCARVHEVHPEVAFFRLNGDRPLNSRKTCAPGLDERRILLAQAGLPEALVRSAPLPGIGRDDHIDAMAALVVACDIARGRATPLPEWPDTDAFGLPIVIWTPGSPRAAT